MGPHSHAPMCELWPRHGHGRSLRDNHFGRRILCKHTWYFMIPKRYCCDTCKQTRAEKIREAEAVLQTAAQSTGVYAAQGNGRSSLPPSLPPATNKFLNLCCNFFSPHSTPSIQAVAVVALALAAVAARHKQHHLPMLLRTQPFRWLASGRPCLPCKAQQQPTRHRTWSLGCM